jgi:hypothetical protein
MTITITAAQRDALYDQLLDRLIGIGDIQVPIQAERIGREYSDDLRLLLDVLGSGDGNGEPVELSAPPKVLRRILPRLLERATDSRPSWSSGGPRSSRSPTKVAWWQRRATSC